MNEEKKQLLILGGLGVIGIGAIWYILRSSSGWQGIQNYPNIGPAELPALSGFPYPQAAPQIPCNVVSSTLCGPAVGEQGVGEGPIATGFGATSGYGPVCTQPPEVTPSGATYAEAQAMMQAYQRMIQ